MATKRTPKAPAATPAPTPPADLRIAQLSEMVDRITYAATHGLQYQGDRDIYQVAGYKRKLTYKDFRDLYERDEIAGALVDMPAETTWRRPPELSEEEHDDGTPFTKEWEKLARRLNVWGTLEAADKLARVGRYSVILIGNGDTDQNLARPIGAVSGAKGILYLAPYSEQYAKIATWVDDGSERHGLPLEYNIDIGGGAEGFRTRRGSGTTRVHASRVIHVAQGLLDDRVFGRPTLQRPFNSFYNLQKVSASGAEAYWQLVTGILQLEIDKEAALSQDEEDALDDALKELYHNLRNTFFAKGGKLSRLSSTPPNPGPVGKFYLTLIAASEGIPMRMLVGSETGERASTEDQKAYMGTIAERQVTFAEPIVFRPLIDKLIEIKGLPRPTTGDYTVAWPDLFQQPEGETAKANLARAQTASALTPAGEDPTKLVEIDKDRNVWLIPKKAEEDGPFEPIEPPEPPPVPGAPEVDPDAPENEPEVPEGGEEE